MKKIKWFLFFVCFCIYSFFFIHYGFYLVAKFTSKIDIRNANSVFLYDNNENLFFQGNGKKEWISLNKMSKHIINATISIEDKNFYHHVGFDYLRIIKSLYENAKSRKYVQGASTITQQYVKNYSLTNISYSIQMSGDNTSGLFIQKTIFTDMKPPELVLRYSFIEKAEF